MFKFNRHSLTAAAQFEHTIPGLVFHRRLRSVDRNLQQSVSQAVKVATLLLLHSASKSVFSCQAPPPLATHFSRRTTQAPGKQNKQ
jgi:hypothetical protein